MKAVSQRLPEGPDPTRRLLLGAVAGVVGSSALSGKVLAADAAGSKIALTEFVLQDIEFRLSTWIPPGDDGDAIDEWVVSTEANLERLVLICDGCGLDPQVKEAVRKVSRVADIYRQLLRDLDLLKYVNDVAAAGRKGSLSTSVDQFKRGYKVGFDFGQCATRFVTNLSLHAAGAAATSGATLIFFVADSLDSVERDFRVKAIQARQQAKTIRGAKERIAQEMQYLSDMSSTLQARFPDLRAPTLEFASTRQAPALNPARTPYAHVCEAYKLLATDGVAAARKFALASDRIPDSVKNVPLAATYVANLPLLAGHLMEFESRVRGDRRLAEEALTYFDRASVLLAQQTTNAPRMAYPYQIAMARAQLAAGRTESALETIRRIQSTAGAEADFAVAARTYDAAGVLARAGQRREALEMLRSSYRAFPRRDPQAMHDANLRDLVATNPDAVMQIVDCPLVGRWKGPSGEYIFYSDGTIWQRRMLITHTGKWQIQDTKHVRLFDRSGLPDSLPAFSVDGDTLTLQTDRVFTFTRDGNAGLLNGVGSGATHSGRVLTSDGRWTWADGRKTHNARFATSSSASNTNRLFWYSHEDPLVGRVSQLLAQE